MTDLAAHPDPGSNDQPADDRKGSGAAVLPAEPEVPVETALSIEIMEAEVPVETVPPVGEARAGPNRFATVTASVDRFRWRTEAELGRVGRSLSIGAESGPQEPVEPLRRWGLILSWTFILGGALTAWVIAGGGGPVHLIGVAAFVAGHLALLATLTFTSAFPRPEL